MAALRVVPTSRVAMDTSSLLTAFGPPLTFQAPAPKLIISDEFNRGVNSVFSLNFSSTGKGPFMAGKAENMLQRCTFQGGGGGGKEWSSGVRDMAPPLEELSSLKHHSLILIPILRKSVVDIFRQQFKTFDPNNVLSLKCVAHKKKS